MRSVRGSCSQVSGAAAHADTSHIPKLIDHLTSSNSVQQIKQSAHNMRWPRTPPGDDNAAVCSPCLRILSMTHFEIVPVVRDQSAALRNGKRQLGVVIPVEHSNIPSAYYIEAPRAQVVDDVNGHVLVEVQFEVQRQAILIRLFSH
jgi:hypothetical protein